MNDRNQILVVDDIEMNREILINIFADDYEVFSAENGEGALSLLEQNDIDIVLLDLSMPKMDGYEVIAAMKADLRFSSIPIVVTTGVLGKSERRAFEMGADDYIAKPYDPFIVRKRVENLIRKYVLQVENLKQALGQAEELNKAKSAFLSRMSHELRTPINSVISTSSLLAGHSHDPQKVVELSEKIEESSRYLLGVINDILDMSAIENQKIVITKSPFDFRRMVESITAMFFASCKEKNITFNMNLVNFTEECLFGDPLRVKEVLVNLISNAVKFTPAGGTVTVKVSQLSRVENMVKLRFEVIDDGVGIAADRQSRIFEPFVQENGDVVQKHGGSGLGLSIVKNITELMGGTVSVRSEKGHGSTFTVDLPFSIAHKMPEVSFDKLKQVRALVVDDDQETQDYVQKMFNTMSIQCDIAQTGDEALAAMRAAFDESHGYDICFIDWRMPGMSGIEMTRAIRSLFADDTVIVVASAYDVAEIDQEAKMAGANVVVSKPMFQSTVFDLLMNITGGQYAAKPLISDNYDFTGHRVLVAEDNALNAEALRDLLELVGFAVDRAADGMQVCEMFAGAPAGTYDAILMDIQMPLMNGHDAARTIRASEHPQACSIPIIAVTANAFTEDVRASLDAGMNDHIAKPIDAERLYNALELLIGKDAPQA